MIGVLFGLVGPLNRTLRSLALAPVTPFAPNLGHVRPVPADRLATLSADVRHVLAIFADGGSSLSSNFGHMGTITTDRFAAFAADMCHVAPILAYHLAPFSPCFSRSEEHTSELQSR